MNYTTEAFKGLLDGLSDMLDCRTDIDGLRRRTPRAAAGAVRVTRRAGDRPAVWPGGPWPMTIRDVLPV
jgi:hypothetical protein